MIRTGIYSVERPEWLAARMHLLTGSDVAVAASVSKYKTREQLRMEKAGLAVDDFVGNEFTETGSYLEPVIVQIAADRYRWQPHLCGELLIDSECADLGATPDYLMNTPWGLAVIQVKATVRSAQEDLKERNADGSPSGAAFAKGPPLDMVLQVQSELAVTGARLGCLLVGHFCKPGFKIRAYPILRNEAAIAQIRAVARSFMSEVRNLREGKVA